MNHVGNISNSSEPIRVAIAFERFGPYHHARLNAAGKRLSVWGLEACAEESTYAWDKVEGAESFQRRTLTRQRGNGPGWRRELHQEMCAALDEIKPQAVVIPGWSSPDALSALAWCVDRNVPSIVMSESTHWDEPRVAWKEWVKRQVVSLCSAGFAGGTPHADYLERLGLGRERIFLGYDSVDNDYFLKRSDAARAEAAALRQRLQLPEKFFLASARFIAKKNLPNLIRAYDRYRAAQSAARREAWHLVLLGDGELRAELEQLIAGLGIGAQVHLPGFKQYHELPAYFGLAQAFIHASTTEQWGLVVNEAMASGLTVLVSERCGCARDLVVDGKNGFVFDPEDVGQLTGLMIKISAGEFPLATFGSESRRIVADWGPQRFADGLYAAVQTAIAEPPIHRGFIARTVLKMLSLR